MKIILAALLQALAGTGATPSGGPALTPAQAAAMSPAELGDALLPFPHRAIVRRLPSGGFHLPPPNASLSTIRLQAAFAPAEADFCSSDVYTVVFNDGSFKDAYLKEAALRPMTVSVQSFYQVATQDTSGRPACGSAKEGFAVGPATKARELFVVRLLIWSQRLARGGSRLPFRLTRGVDRAPQGRNADRRALANLALDAITFVQPTAYGPLTDARRAELASGSPGRLPDTATIRLGGGRAIQLLLAGDALTGVYLDLSFSADPYI